MCRSILFLVALPLFSGFQRNPDREQMKEFLQVLEKAAGHSYDKQMKDCPKEEWFVRWAGLFFRDHVTDIDRYLATKPKLTPYCRAMVDDLRRISLEETELFEGLVAQKRFKLTDEENKRKTELHNEYIEKIAEIGKYIDGIE